MEKSIFPRPEVLRELSKYVELRLHTDRSDERSKALKALKEKSLGDLALVTPVYEIIDPGTKARIDLFQGADILTNGEKFRDFLARNARK